MLFCTDADDLLFVVVHSFRHAKSIIDSFSGEGLLSMVRIFIVEFYFFAKEKQIQAKKEPWPVSWCYSSTEMYVDNVLKKLRSLETGKRKKLMTDVFGVLPSQPS